MQTTHPIPDTPAAEGRGMRASQTPHPTPLLMSGADMGVEQDDFTQSPLCHDLASKDHAVADVRADMGRTLW